MVDAAQIKRPYVPGRIWYFIASLFVIAGLAAMAVLLFAELNGISARLTQVVVPGQAELNLNQPGSYTIFHEYQSSVDGHVYAINSVSGLVVTVTSKATGQAIPVVPATANSTYEFGGRSGRSILSFQIAAPGAYQLVAAYSDGRTEPQTVLAVGHGFLGSLVFTVLAGLGVMFAGALCTAGIVIFVAIKRHKAKRLGLI